MASPGNKTPDEDSRPGLVTHSLTVQDGTPRKDFPQGATRRPPGPRLVCGVGTSTSETGIPRPFLLLDEDPEEKGEEVEGPSSLGGRDMERSLVGSRGVEDPGRVQLAEGPSPGPGG